MASLSKQRTNSHLPTVRTKPWHARIWMYGKEHHLGFFATREEAVAAEVIARERYRVEVVKEGIPHQVSLVNGQVSFRSKPEPASVQKLIELEEERPQREEQREMRVVLVFRYFGKTSQGWKMVLSLLRISRVKFGDICRIELFDGQEVVDVNAET